MRLILLSLAGAACLAACTPAAEDPAEPAGPTAPAPAPAPSPAPAAPTTPDSPPADACGAAERQGWVGQPRSAVPATPAGANWRIFETGQPVTQDLRPDRLNVEINPDTQQVVSVRCG